MPSGMQLSLVRRASAFAFLLCAEFFYSWGWNTVDILRPYLRESLKLDAHPGRVRLLCPGSWGTGRAPCSSGQLADRLGRRNMLVAVMLGYGSLLLAGVFVASYLELLLQRFCLGIFLGGSFPVVVGIYVGPLQNPKYAAVSPVWSARCSAHPSLPKAMHSGTSLVTIGDCLLWLGGVPPILLAFFAYAVVPFRSSTDCGARQAASADERVVCSVPAAADAPARIADGGLISSLTRRSADGSPST